MLFSTAVNTGCDLATVALFIKNHVRIVFFCRIPLVFIPQSWRAMLVPVLYLYIYFFFPVWILHWLMCSPGAVNKFSIFRNGLVCEGSQGSNFLLPSRGGRRSTFVLRFYSELSFSWNDTHKIWDSGLVYIP